MIRYDFEGVLDECGYDYLRKAEKTGSARAALASAVELARFKACNADSLIV